VRDVLQLPFGFLTSVLSGQNIKYSPLFLWQGTKRAIHSQLNCAILLCDVIPDGKNWVNWAVLTGNSAGLRTVLSSRLPHVKLRSSIRESHTHSVQFFVKFVYTVKLHSLTLSVWGPLETILTPWLALRYMSVVLFHTVPDVDALSGVVDVLKL